MNDMLELKEDHGQLTVIIDGERIPLRLKIRSEYLQQNDKLFYEFDILGNKVQEHVKDCNFNDMELYDELSRFLTIFKKYQLIWSKNGTDSRSGTFLIENVQYKYNIGYPSGGFSCDYESDYIAVTCTDSNKSAIIGNPTLDKDMNMFDDRFYELVKEKMKA